MVEAILYTTATSDTATRDRLDKVLEYATNNIPGMRRDIEDRVTVDDVMNEIEGKEYPTASIYGENGDVAAHVFTDRPDLPTQYALPAATHADVINDADHWVTPSLSTLDMDTIEDLVELNVTIHSTMQHVTIRGAEIDNLDNATRYVAQYLTGDEIDGATLLAGIEHTGGRPPLGTTSSRGQLQPADNYRKVCSVLQDVKDERTSKRRAADRLDCVPATIDNALNRPALYQLED